MASITENRSALKQFLYSISSIKGDLSNITAPPFVLATKSAVEFPSSWAENPSILIAPALEPDPRKRALLVLKWYLASLRRQQYSGGDESQGVKKPLNAVLGELFIGSFGSDGKGGTTKESNGISEGEESSNPSVSNQKARDLGETSLVAEQVSHHPPVTACHLWNKKHNVRASGYTAQVITLSKTFSVRIEQIGHAIVYLDDLQEAYLVTLPTLTVKGLMSGTPYPELEGTTYITSSTGFTSKVEYEGAGFFGGGTRNQFKAKLFATKDENEVFYEAEGAWNGTFTFYDVSDSSGDRKELETYDTHAAVPAELELPSLEEQDSWESRVVWKEVIHALRTGDFNKVNTEKSKVEEAQRGLRKREQQEGKSWEAAMFSKIEKDPVFDELAKGIAYKEDSTKTAGVWKFDLEKYENKAKPYHGGLTPLG